MLFFCLLLSALGTSTAMLVPSLLAKQRPLLKRSVAPLRFARHHTTLPSPDLALISAMQSAHDLYLNKPHQTHDRLASFTIANAVRRDPVLSEALNMMIPHMSKFYASETLAGYELDFRKSDAVGQAFQVREDEQGPYLWVRDGLAIIRPSGEDGISFHRPEKTIQMMRLMPALSAMLMAKFCETSLETPVSKVAFLFGAFSKIIDLDQDTKSRFKEASLANPVADSYKDYGLLIFGPKGRAVNMSIKEYCKTAGMTRNQTVLFNNLLASLKHH